MDSNMYNYLYGIGDRTSLSSQNKKSTKKSTKKTAVKKTTAKKTATKKK
jgi:hypothetical protein